MSRPKLYAWGEWRFEPAEYRLMRGDERITLPGKTLDLLAVLVSRAPRLATKAEILGAVWPDSSVEEGNIAFHVAALRKTLDGDDQPTCIETVRGRGYRFVASLVVTPVIIPPSTQSLDLPAAIRSMDVARPRSWWRPAAALVVVALIAGVGGRAILKSAEPERVLIMPFAIESTNDIEKIDLSLAQFIVTTLSEAGVQAVPMDDGILGETPRAAAERLGVTTVLTGELKKIGDRQWRVSVRLMLSAEGKVAWNWTFDAGPTELPVQLQSEIASAIASGLRQRLAERLR